jgi:hypothetical protein
MSELEPMLIFESLYAEIERLKGELVKAYSEVTYQRTLITELADALFCNGHKMTSDPCPVCDLIQRAMEATNER